jgi:hypothetical protein
VTEAVDGSESDHQTQQGTGDAGGEQVEYARKRMNMIAGIRPEQGPAKKDSGQQHAARVQQRHQGKAIHSGKGAVENGWDMPAPHDGYGRQPGKPAPFVKEGGHSFQHMRGGVRSYAHYQQRPGYQQQNYVSDHMGAEIDMHTQEMQG